MLLLAVAIASCGGSDAPAPPDESGGSACAGRCIEIGPGDNDQETLQLALIDARPGDVITLRAGTYHLTGQLSLDVDDVTLRGEGMDKTILSFRQQTTGAEGLLVTANGFTIEDLGLEDAPGDILKILGCDGLVIRRVRAEWTGGPATSNGSYGFYPIECRNVLIEGSVVRGASDAGIYVGQCDNIIVRGNTAEYNVAGIEIENSTDADVFDNLATHNTGGILVFNLPGLPFTDGRRTRVYGNRVITNNTENFAPPGTTVSAVPKGTGLMILANDDVEVTDNTFRDNGTTHVLLISYKTAQLIGGFRTNDREYDHYSEGLWIHGNRFEGGGQDPEPSTAEIVGDLVGGGPLPNIIFDGYVNERKYVDGALPARLRTCIQEAAVTFINIDVPHGASFASLDVGPFNCAQPALSAVVVPGADEPPPPRPTPNAAPATPRPPIGSSETRCRIPAGTGVNFDPADNPCDLLSSYRFFVGDEAEQQPNDGVIPYDLNTQLFSDYTVKHRFIWVPPERHATYDATESFDFPVGTVVIKSFAYPVDLRDPSLGADLIETRLLVRRAHGWVGLPYVWNDARTDARLRVLGAPLTVSGVQTDGEVGTFPYNVPNANQCKGCHDEHGGIMGLLGVKARNLNKDYPYAEGTENQLAYWTRKGLLGGAPAPVEAPRAAVFDDPQSGSLEQRARTYLDVNCGNCHNASGPARTTGLYLTVHETDPTHLGICKSPVAAGRGTGGRMFGIAPGQPAQSILVFRMGSTEPGIAMPELGRRRVHAEGVGVISEWIASLEGDCEEP